MSQRPDSGGRLRTTHLQPAAIQGILESDDGERISAVITNGVAREILAKDRALATRVGITLVRRDLASGERDRIWNVAASPHVQWILDADPALAARVRPILALRRHN